MLSSRQFNLLNQVNRKKRLSLKWFVGVIVVYFICLLGFSISKITVTTELQGKLSIVEKQVSQAMAVLAPKLNEGDEGNKLVGVLPESMVIDDKGFYKEFNELSKLVVRGVWINSISIDRQRNFLKLEGGTFATSSLDTFFSLLKEQPLLGSLSYEGISITKGTLPKLSYSAKQKAKNLVVPKFFKFVIQTSQVKQQTAKKKEVLL